MKDEEAKAEAAAIGSIRVASVIAIRTAVSAGISAKKAGASPAKAAFIAEKAGADAAVACIQDDIAEIKAAELEGIEAAAADIRKDEAMAEAAGAAIKAAAWRINKDGTAT